jgi:hypothetical protein
MDTSPSTHPLHRHHHHHRNSRISQQELATDGVDEAGEAGGVAAVWRDDDSQRMKDNVADLVVEAGVAGQRHDEAGAGERQSTTRGSRNDPCWRLQREEQSTKTKLGITKILHDWLRTVQVTKGDLGMV